MGRIEVDEEKLRRFVNASLFTCMDLNYNLFHKKICHDECCDCPLDSAEKVQEIVEEKDAEYKKLEEEYSYLKEEYGELEEACQDLKKENNTLKRKCKSYEDGSKTVWSIYNKDLEKMKDLQMFNNKLVKSNKTANRDFFILAAAYVATLMLMIYLFIR